MAGFVGRQRELDTLHTHLREVQDTGAGTFLSVRGRRQVGKSRLVEEFLGVAGVPCAFFAAARRANLSSEIHEFATELAGSTLQAAPLFENTAFGAWEQALRLLAANVTTPSILVMDELPYLLEADPSLEGTLQRTWDRYLSRVPILLIVIGSDLSTMEMLGSYDRPLYQRMREMVVHPFNVAEVVGMLGLDDTNAIDAYLTVGGFPTLAGSWRHSRSLSGFLKEGLADATSPLIVVGERILAAEFPAGLQAREVLQAVGSGETTFSSIGRRTGINQGSLTRTLQILSHDKRVLQVDHPLSSRPSRNSLYRVADPYLRFWLRFIGPNMELLLRGRGELLASQIAAQWSDYRGRAVEPLIRSSIEQHLPDDRFGNAVVVGAYWTRTNDLEVDLIGARAPDPPTQVSFVGSIKWRDRSSFNRSDLADLAAARARVPGAEDALLVGVSRSGFATSDLDVALGPSDIVSAWRS